MPDTVLDVGIDPLLRQAGVAKASLYGHFGSKDGLVVAWLDERQARWFGYFDAFVTARAGPADPEGALDAAFGFLASWFERPDFGGCPFVATYLQLKDARHPAAAVAQAYAARLLAFFHGNLAALRVDRPDEVAGALLELFLGAVVARQMGVSSAPAASAAGAARRLYAAATRRRRAAPRGAAVTSAVTRARTGGAVRAR